jgi:aerobic-type carbon monoxide dehydrogenase small subunit (CoxS/CutS family)
MTSTPANPAVVPSSVAPSSVAPSSVAPSSIVPPPAAEPTARHQIRVNINGRQIEAEVESRLLLADFLRHRVGLTGTHLGCEQGSCGACTILVDGLAVRSCLMLAPQANGREIRTVESLAEPGGPLSPIQEAFTNQHGLQCGFCTPGFLCSLTAFAEEAEDTGREVLEAELEEQLDSSFCRCTGYVNIRRAARQAFGFEPGGAHG